MGSVLGLIFNNFYMLFYKWNSWLVLKTEYTYDIIVLANDTNEINILKDTFQKKIQFLILPSN